MTANTKTVSAAVLVALGLGLVAGAAEGCPVGMDHWEPDRPRIPRP